MTIQIKKKFNLVLEEYLINGIKILIILDMMLKHKKYKNKIKVFKISIENTIDSFIKRNEDKNWWKTIKDELN